MKNAIVFFVLMPFGIFLFSAAVIGAIVKTLHDRGNKNGIKRRQRLANSDGSAELDRRAQAGSTEGSQ